MQNNKRQKEDDDSGLRADALQHVQIFNDEGLTYGIPSKLFWLGFIISLTISFMLKWYVGPVFAAVYFLSMYEIHKDDPKAISAWVDAALNRRKEIWVTGLHKQRKLKIIDRK